MTRSGCVAYLKEQATLHEVPRSACVCCPFKINFEWRHLRNNDPADWARAVEVDEALRRPGTLANRNLEQAIYLHRSCLPLVEVDLDQRDASGGVAGSECEGDGRIVRGGCYLASSKLQPLNPIRHYLTPKKKWLSRSFRL